jgi:hypothetical protein
LHEKDSVSSSKALSEKDILKSRRIFGGLPGAAEGAELGSVTEAATPKGGKKTREMGIVFAGNRLTTSLTELSTASDCELLRGL